MEQEYIEYCQCTACGETLTDEAAFFDVEADDAPYCLEERDAGKKIIGAAE